jgi:hypothetical protein
MIFGNRSEISNSFLLEVINSLIAYLSFDQLEKFSYALSGSIEFSKRFILYYAEFCCFLFIIVSTFDDAGFIAAGFLV